MYRLLLVVFLGMFTSQGVLAANRQLKGPPATRTALPQEQPYQKVLRDFLLGLTEKDFSHGVSADMSEKLNQDLEYQYRQYLFTLLPQPLVGTKRGTPAVNASARLFVLSAIERPEGVMVPPVWPETLMSFVLWKDPGNPYFDNRALKLRSFVTASVMMLMLDDQLQHHPERGGSRADWLAYQLIVYASPYAGFKDLLPRPVQQAYETLLRRMGRRILAWGPKGEEPNFDIITALGLWYVGKALEDPAFTREVEDYARRLYADPAFFHPAGYFLDNRGIDVGYQGMTNYFAIWTALASKWPFAKDAVERCYRLRAHLVLPEPDGVFVGPSHFNSRTSSDAWDDQWGWGGARDITAALVTDEAAFLSKLPSAEELKNAPGKRAGMFKGQLRENPVNGKGGFIGNDEIASNPWKWRMWHSFNFPGSVNFAYEFYPPGAYAHRLDLQQKNSPWLKSPFQRDESFLRDFGRAFTVARYPSHAAIVHSGPVGSPGLEDGLFKFAGPLGFGGGQLSAFWTPATGAVLLGRRGGNSWSKAFDVVEEWRTWPIHAVSGCKSDGKVFTTARIAQLQVQVNHKDLEATVQVKGALPVEQFGQGKVLEGRIGYTRTFHLDRNQVRVVTTLEIPGQDKFAELYETLPVFLSDAGRQPKATPTVIEFEVDGKWQPATAEYQERVSRVKLTRFAGAVGITFDRPRRLKLAPVVWQDKYLSRAQCRNVLVDLLDGGSPVVPNGERSLSYQISALPGK